MFKVTCYIPRHIEIFHHKLFIISACVALLAICNWVIVKVLNHGNGRVNPLDKQGRIRKLQPNSRLHGRSRDIKI